MYFFLTYLLRSSLIRITVVWLFISMIGISLFSYKLIGMRSDLYTANLNVQSFIGAIQKIDAQNVGDRARLDDIIDEIDKFRPSVPDLLVFINDIEGLAIKRGLDMEFNTIKTSIKEANDDDSIISYKISITSELDAVMGFLKDFENSNYAINIKSIDMKEIFDEDGISGGFKLDIIFILHSRIV